MDIKIVVVGLLAFWGAYAQGQEHDKNGSDSEFIDFEDTLVEGQMKAPSGFFIQGNGNDIEMEQMVKLRSDFKKKLLRSSEIIKAIVK